MVPELSDSASNLLPKKEKEPAVVSISDYIKTDCYKEAGNVSAKSILSKFSREEE